MYNALTLISNRLSVFKRWNLGEKTDISEYRLYAGLRELKQINVGQEAFEIYLLLLEPSRIRNP